MLTFSAAWHPKVSIEQMGRIESVGRETRKISFGTHTGTHMDAPLHFVKGGKAIDEISIKDLIGDVSIIDFSHLKDNGCVTEKMLKNIKVTEKTIFKFGWGKYWGKKKFYKGWPFFSKEAAEYLIKKGVKMAAMDTPSPDDSRIKLSGKNLGSEKDSPIHKIFLRSGVILVEYLANLDKIKDCQGWIIVVAPLKIKGADGSPIRAFIYK